MRPTTAPLVCRCGDTAGRAGCPVHSDPGVSIKLFQVTACANGHDFVVGTSHAVCNRCEKVIKLPQVAS